MTHTQYGNRCVDGVRALLLTYAMAPMLVALSLCLPSVHVCLCWGGGGQQACARIASVRLLLFLVCVLTQGSSMRVDGSLMLACSCISFLAVCVCVYTGQQHACGR